MAPIFNRFRFRLLTENRFTRYLVYALGEIILVVIGILIALQVNTYNQQKKDRIAEGKILHKMIMDVEGDLDRLTLIDSLYSENLEVIREAYNILGQPELNDDEIASVMYFHGAQIMDVNCRETTYNEMMNSGNIYKLKNEELLEQIIEYYRLAEEVSYQAVEDRREFRNLFYGPEFMDFFYLRSVDTEDLALARAFFDDHSSKNYRALVQAVNWSSGLIARGQRRVRSLIEANNTLHETLEEELHKRNHN